MLVVFSEELSYAFVFDSLIGYEIGTRPIKNTVSYGVLHMCLVVCSKDSQSEQSKIFSGKRAIPQKRINLFSLILFMDTALVL